MATGEAVAPPAAPSSEFYIAVSSSLLERRPRTLKHDDTFAVFDHHGDIVAAPHGPEGLYHEDTRHLSRFEVRLAGEKPLLLGSVLQDDNAVLTADLANADIHRRGRLVLRRDVIHLRRTKYLWDAACHERIALRNFGATRQRIALDILFDADFRDLFEVRGERRARRGTVRVTVEEKACVLYRYDGLDGLERRTDILLRPHPARLQPGRAHFSLTLAPGGRATVFVTVRCRPPASPVRDFFPCLREARRAVVKRSSTMAAVATSNEIFNEMLCRSTADLAMLITETSRGPYPYAGIPWFSTVFGRDGIVTALETLWLAPEIARGVLGYLALTQATEVDPVSEAAPGKIVHEMRKGEMARLGEVPFRCYYGSIDATPLFVLLAGAYHRRTGDIETIAQLWPNIEAALGWIDAFGDRDGDGFVEYLARDGHGLVNQGWKDSQDSVFHADGSNARGPIALCEVQAYVYAARREAAAMARALDLAVVAATEEHRANSIRERFEAAFWCDDLGTYALALDGDKRPCRVRASNAGHALYAGIAGAERAARVAETLLGGGSFTGWGIRTLGAGEARFNPMSYHNGSVWPHDNALIAAGLSRYGRTHELLQVFEGLFGAAQYMDLRRLPELFCGFVRRRGQGPTLYPVACAPQAWASAAPFALIAAALGMECDALAGEVRFRHPILPGFLDELVIRNLGLGDARLDLLFRRHASDVAVNVLSREGDARVSVIL